MPTSRLLNRGKKITWSNFSGENPVKSPGLFCYISDFKNGQLCDLRKMYILNDPSWFVQVHTSVLRISE